MCRVRLRIAVESIISGRMFVSSFVMRADSNASARNNENYERFVALAGPAAGGGGRSNCLLNSHPNNERLGRSDFDQSGSGAAAGEAKNEKKRKKQPKLLYQMDYPFANILSKTNHRIVINRCLEAETRNNEQRSSELIQYFDILRTL